MRKSIKNFGNPESGWILEPTLNRRKIGPKGPRPHRVEDPPVFQCCPPEPIRKESASHHVCVKSKHVPSARRFCDFRLCGWRYQGRNVKFSNFWIFENGDFCIRQIIKNQLNIHLESYCDWFAGSWFVLSCFLSWWPRKIAKRCRNAKCSRGLVEKLWKPCETTLKMIAVPSPNGFWNLLWTGEKSVQRGPGHTEWRTPWCSIVAPLGRFGRRMLRTMCVNEIEHLPSARRFCDFRHRGGRYQGQSMKLSKCSLWEWWFLRSTNH